jgi:hypothetical protein
MIKSRKGVALMFTFSFDPEKNSNYSTAPATQKARAGERGRVGGK